jgi:hypothetical protein
VKACCRREFGPAERKKRMEGGNHLRALADACGYALYRA